MIEGDQRTQGRLASVEVVPDGCRECQQPLEDPGEHAFVGSAAVSLQVELALQGVIDGFDELAQGLQEPAVRPGLLVGTGRTDERGAMIGVGNQRSTLEASWTPTWTPLLPHCT